MKGGNERSENHMMHFSIYKSIIILNQVPNPGFVKKEKSNKFSGIPNCWENTIHKKVSRRNSGHIFNTFTQTVTILTEYCKSQKKTIDHW